DAATWGRHDLLIFVEAHGNELYALSLKDFRARLEQVTGERWWRTVPTQEEDYSGAIAAPGVLVRGAPYWWQAPDGANTFDVAGESLERVSDNELAVAFRRW